MILLYTSTMNHFILLLATTPPMLSSTPSKILLSVWIVQTHTLHTIMSPYIVIMHMCLRLSPWDQTMYCGAHPCRKKMRFFFFLHPVALSILIH